MYIGEQLGDLSERKLTWAAQLGVEHVAVATPTIRGIEQEDGTWDVAALKSTKVYLESFGIAFDVLALNMQSNYMTQQRFPGIMRGLPSRDAEIEVIKQNIRAASEAGIPALKYNLSLIGIPRTGRTPGRGGVTYSHFDINKWTDHSLTEAGPMPPEKMWENMTYFLERVVPVAEEYGVRLACHPHDPAVPHDTGLRGVHRVLGSVDGLKRLLSIAPSPYHGLNFCQGTVSEMCRDPATEVLEAIRHFGSEQKIFMVHFRNIRGGYLNFEEVYPDNGDVDMYKALQVYKSVGFEGMLCPDHVPQSTVDPDGERQHSFCLGYTRALIQAVNSSQ